MKVNPNQTLIRIKVESKSAANGFFSTHNNDSVENYYLNIDGETIMPYRTFITFRKDSQIAEIDLSKLFEYPNNLHVLHVTPYNKNNIYMSMPEYKIIVDFLRVKLDREIDRTFTIFFTQAFLSHNTEKFGKMKTYIKLSINEQLVWTSSSENKIGRQPVYNQSRTFNINGLEDKIKVQIWDKDMKHDDLVGQFSKYAFELLSLVGEECTSELGYEGKVAGRINYVVQEAPKII